MLNQTGALQTAGSYYLTNSARLATNLVDYLAITAAANTTIDVNGFTLELVNSTPQNSTVIATTNVADRFARTNGRLKGFRSPVIATPGSRLTDLEIVDAASSIQIAAGAPGTEALPAIIERCQISNASQLAIFSESAAIIQDCVIDGAAGGIAVFGDALIENCTLRNISNNAVFVSGNAVIRNCTIEGGASIAINVTGDLEISGSRIVNGTTSLSVGGSAIMESCSIETTAGPPFTIEGTLDMRDCSIRGGTSAATVDGAADITDSVFRGDPDSTGGTMTLGTGSTLRRVNVESGGVTTLGVNATIQSCAFSGRLSAELLSIGQGSQIRDTNIQVPVTRANVVAVNGSTEIRGCRFERAALIVNGRDCRIEGNTFVFCNLDLNMTTFNTVVRNEISAAGIVNISTGTNQIGPTNNLTSPWTNFFN